MDYVFKNDVRISNGALYVNDIKVIDENGNIDAPVTTTDLTTTGNTTIGDAAGDTLTINALTTVATNQKIQFRDTGIYINSWADGKLTISADGSGTDDITLSGTITLDDDLITPTTKKVQFRDSALYISSKDDGHLDIDADVSVDINSPLFNIPSAGTIAGIGTGANGIVLKNLKNAAASALSGTQLDIEIDIGGTPYYFTVYPTKA